MQQIAQFALVFLLGSIAYAAIHMMIVERREEKRSKERHPSNNYSQLGYYETHEYSNLDRKDGLGQ